jgi:hypothetical protein
MVLMVALLGLFALSSLMIEQKLKDVAIRKTLGASESTLVLDLPNNSLDYSNGSFRQHSDKFLSDERMAERFRLQNRYAGFSVFI